MALIACPECGMNISSAAASCPHCGCPMEKTKTCPECNAEISQHAETCPMCGHPQYKVIVEVELPANLQSFKWSFIKPNNAGFFARKTILADGMGTRTAEFDLNEPETITLMKAAGASLISGIMEPGKRYRCFMKGIFGIWHIAEV